MTEIYKTLKSVVKVKGELICSFAQYLTYD